MRISSSRRRQRPAAPLAAVAAALLAHSALAPADAAAQQRTQRGQRARMITVSAAAAAADVFERAQRLVAEGQGDVGRAVVDSVLSSSNEGSEAYAEALFWRASLAATAADAERDYRTLAVEYSLSPRSADALMRLAQLEMARGDRAGAIAHLERLVLEHPTSPSRPRASYWMARVYFDGGDAPRACAALDAARASASKDDAGLRSQVDAYGPRCKGVTAVAATPASGVRDSVLGNRESSVAAAPVVAPAKGSSTPAYAAAASSDAASSPFAGAALPAAALASAAAPSAAPAAPSTAPPAVAPAPAPLLPDAPAPAPPAEPSARPAPRVPRPAFSVQVAAYSASAPAESLVRTLRARGLDARVSGSAAPYRVRIGRYATEAEATRAAAALKKRGQPAWVVEDRAP